MAAKTPNENDDVAVSFVCFPSFPFDRGASCSGLQCWVGILLQMQYVWHSAPHTHNVFIL